MKICYVAAVASEAAFMNHTSGREPLIKNFFDYSVTFISVHPATVG
jgi:hypothetical protein